MASTPPRRNSAGLRRDLELMEILGLPEAVSGNGLGVVRIAGLSGRDKGQVSRTLATLAEAGLVARDSTTQNYRLGYQLYALAARTFESRLVREAAPFLRRVVLATHETAHLCVLRGDNVLTLTSELSEHAFRGIGWEGVSVAAWRTSSGRVLISDRAEEDLQRWYDLHGSDRPVTGPVARVMKEVGMAAPVEGKPLFNDFSALLQEIHRIRARGFATVEEEFELGVVGASAPVYDFRGRIAAAINVSAPKSRVGSQLTEMGAVISNIAMEFSQHLGALR